MNNTIKPVAVVSAILEQTKNGQKYIFVQKRWKPKASPNYLGVWEIPAGGIEAYENIHKAIKREVEEETGLKIVRFIDDYQSPVSSINTNDSSIAFKPFICQQVLETNGGLPWVGFVFRCEVEGVFNPQASEVKDPQWMNVKELKEIIQNSPEKIFSLQLATLKYYLEVLEKEESLS
jgi:8-oxo-dGTP pyrophosphatase MutT (NUDIX family)